MENRVDGRGETKIRIVDDTSANRHRLETKRELFHLRFFLSTLSILSRRGTSQQAPASVYIQNSYARNVTGIRRIVFSKVIIRRINNATYGDVIRTFPQGSTVLVLLGEGYYKNRVSILGRSCIIHFFTYANFRSVPQFTWRSYTVIRRRVSVLYVDSFLLNFSFSFFFSFFLIGSKSVDSSAGLPLQLNS